MNISGPAFGSFLYTLGGFSLPFIALGIVNMALSIIIMLQLRKVQDANMTSQVNEDGYQELEQAKKRVITKNEVLTVNIVLFYCLPYNRDHCNNCFTVPDVQSIIAIC